MLWSAGWDIRLKRPKGAKGKIVTEFLSVDDAFGIIAAADRENRAFGMLLRFLLYTGCRIGEAMALRWENVQFDQGLAYFVTSKNDDPRTVKLQRDLCEEMPAFAGGATQGPVFPFRRGGGLKDRLVRAKLAVCGIKPKPRKRTETKAASPVVGRLPYVLPHVGNLDAALWRR